MIMLKTILLRFILMSIPFRGFRRFCATIKDYLKRKWSSIKMPGLLDTSQNEKNIFRDFIFCNRCIILLSKHYCSKAAVQ